MQESRLSKPLTLSAQQVDNLNAIGKRLRGKTPHWIEANDTGTQEDEVSVVRCTPTFGGKHQVLVSNAIGALSVDDLTLVIQPKIPMDHLVYLFDRSQYFPRIDTTKALSDTGTSFWHVIARLFMQALRPIVRDGMLQSYSPQDGELPVLRGKIKPLPTYRSLVAGNFTFHSSFEEYSVDTAANRILKAACLQVATSPSLPSDLRRQARSISHQMALVGDYRTSDLTTPDETRDNRYLPAMSLGRLIAQGSDLSLDSGSIRGSSFLIPTPAVIEEGVRNVISDGFGQSIPVTKQSKRLEPDSVTMNPDIVIARPPVITADVKYSIATPEWKRSDLYQAISFAEAFQVSTALMIGFGKDPGTCPVAIKVGTKHVSFLPWRTDLSPEEASVTLQSSCRNLLAQSVTSVPQPNDSWDAITQFALSYNGYRRFNPNQKNGDAAFEALADFANAASAAWERSRLLPATLHELRCALFFEQRRSGQGFPFDFDPSQEWGDPESTYSDWITYVKALVQRINEIAGNTLAQTSDYEGAPLLVSAR